MTEPSSSEVASAAPVGRRAFGLDRGPRRTPEELRDAVLPDVGDVAAKRSRFWVLLVLSSVIATAGVLADSTAAVIGAMIVAPLATPIHGVAVSIVEARPRSLAASATMLATGAAVVVGIGAAIAFVMPDVVVSRENDQVAGRVHPGIIDILAASATGFAGAVALARKDIADILPGVAIAISLVPPLAVVGVVAESGHAGEAVGALLLFGTNVIAMIVTACAVLTVLGYAAASDPAFDRGRLYRVVGGSAIVLGTLLALGSFHTVRREIREADALAIAREWADRGGERAVEARYEGNDLHVLVVGPGSGRRDAELSVLLRAAVPDGTTVVVDRLTGTRTRIGKVGGGPPGAADVARPPSAARARE